jgi:hypothetical protein
MNPRVGARLESNPQLGIAGAGRVNKSGTQNDGTSIPTTAPKKFYRVKY